MALLRCRVASTSSTRPHDNLRVSWGSRGRVATVSPNAGLEEDDPKNPATIADNVGDNVGDVAGMGSDLFGSLAESTCAALVIASTSSDLLDAGWAALLFPLTISAAGMVVCMACSFIATDLKPVVREADVESALKLQLISTTFLVVPVVVYLAHSLLPDKFELPSVVSGTIKASSTGAAICVSVGALGGLLIGLVTEYYTSHSYEPVRECAHVCKQGAAVNLIYGLALGYRSAIVPVYTLAAIVYFSFSLAVVGEKLTGKSALITCTRPPEQRDVGADTPDPMADHGVRCHAHLYESRGAPFALESSALSLVTSSRNSSSSRRPHRPWMSVFESKKSRSSGPVMSSAAASSAAFAVLTGGRCSATRARALEPFSGSKSSSS